MLVSASPTASRPEAGASSSATGERSPIAIASPAKLSKPRAVTPTSLTGTCHGPDQLVPGHQSADRPVADVNEEGLVRHGRQAQHAQARVRQLDAGQVQGIGRHRLASHLPDHLRRLAEQRLQRHVHGRLAEQPVGHDEPAGCRPARPSTA